MDRFSYLKARKRKCKKCGMVMDYLALGEYRCPSCRIVELDDYGIVRHYLDEHGSATASMIEAETGVRREIIDDYLRKGRLEITENSAVFLKCERCGKDIKFGRVCASCAKNAVTKLNKAFPIDEIGEEPISATQKKEGGRMHISRDKW